MSHHYRQPLNFTLESLQAAEKTVKRINDFYERFSETKASSTKSDILDRLTKEANEKFRKDLNNDLNIVEALAHFFTWMNEANASMDKQGLSANAKKEGEKFLNDFSSVLDIFDTQEIDIPEHVKRLAGQREEARKKHDFKRSDELRDAAKKEGFVFVDTAEGVKIKKL
jgi:cysteinyl-tRNA synthetase